MTYLEDYNPPELGHGAVVFTDRDIIVVDKPSGLLSVPGRVHKVSVVSHLEADFGPVHIAHRLDMDTSGLMVFARSPEAHKALSRQFEARSVHKRYEALVWGHPPNTGEINAPTIKDWPNRPRQMIDHENGKPSQTHYTCLAVSGEHAYVRLTPVTGRTHQLRVHMNHIGHPILGDPFYGHEESHSARDRLCLHACELAFEHPTSGEPVRFASERPF